MTEWLNYNHLYYFWVIASEGSITKACAKLRLAQPTLSAQLRTLEDNLGHALFERKHRKLHLTQAGKLVYDYAQQIFSLGNELQSSLESAAHGEPSKIVIGVVPSLPKYIIHDLLMTVLGDGKVFATLREASMSVLLKELSKHHVDILLSDQPPPARPGSRFFADRISEIKMAIVGHPKYESLKENFPQSLNQAPMMLLTSNSPMRADIDHFFELQRVYPKVVGEIEDVSLLRLFALSGVALVSVPKDSVKEDLWLGKLSLLGELKSVSTSLWAITASRRMPNTLVENLIQKRLNHEPAREPREEASGQPSV